MDQAKLPRSLCLKVDCAGGHRSCSAVTAAQGAQVGGLCGPTLQHADGAGCVSASHAHPVALLNITVLDCVLQVLLAPTAANDLWSASKPAARVHSRTSWQQASC